MIESIISIMRRDDNSKESIQEPSKPLLDRVRIQVKLSKQNANKEQLFVINTFDTQNGQCIEVTVRKILQVEYLAQDINEKYGGFVIPVLDLNNIFKRKQPLQKVIIQISEYLNDLAKNGHCNRDSKLCQFLFHQEVHFPNIERYDKVLSDAAVYSRRYLNSIFTRKEVNQVKTQHIQLISVYSRFKSFVANFQEIKKIIIINSEQQELLEDIFASLCEIRGGLAKGVQPIDFATSKMRKQIYKLDKVIFEAQEAYYRWEVLSETVKELQCNLLKGLHEDNSYYYMKIKQLKSWSKTLQLDIKQVIIIGEKILQEISIHLYQKKKQQMTFNLSQNQQASKDHFILPKIQQNNSQIQIAEAQLLEQKTDFHQRQQLEQVKGH